MATSPIIAEHHPFVKEIARGLRRRCGVNPGDHVMVAVSGGADSVALLRAMAILAPRHKWRLTLTAAHVQHHLRDDAEADAEFVRDLAAALDTPFVRRDIAPAKAAGNLESSARRARYAALRCAAVDAGARLVATAHHADDQLETVLMRLLRGTGVRGMRGIAWRRPLRSGDDPPVALIRPMLACTRDTARDFLDAIDQPWREDHTNNDVTRTRARLRHEVLPILLDMQPASPRKAVAFAEQMRDLHALVEAQVDALLDEHGTRSLPRRAAREAPRAVLTAYVRRVLVVAGVPTDRLGSGTVSAIARAARDTRGGRRTFDLSQGITAVVTADAVEIVG